MDTVYNRSCPLSLSTWLSVRPLFPMLPGRHSVRSAITELGLSVRLIGDRRHSNGDPGKADGVLVRRCSCHSMLQCMKLVSSEVMNVN